MIEMTRNFQQNIFSQNQCHQKAFIALVWLVSKCDRKTNAKTDNDDHILKKMNQFREQWEKKMPHGSYSTVWHIPSFKS